MAKMSQSKRDRTMQIVESGFGGHRSNLWNNIVDSVKSAVEKGMDAVEPIADAIREKLPNEDIPNDDLSRYIADARRMVEERNSEGREVSQEDIAMLEAAARRSGGMNQIEESVYSDNVGDQMSIGSDRRNYVEIAGEEKSLSAENATATMDDIGEPTFLDERPEYQYEESSREGRSRQEGLANIQNMLYSVDDGKYLPKGEDAAGDGYYGDNTAKAVRQFAKDNGIESDGSRITSEIIRLLEARASQ